ncbi:MAG: zinc ribbon domain-containing protein [bacterium]|nr:zinc ribbon domain-containing protein [bacterium]
MIIFSTALAAEAIAEAAPLNPMPIIIFVIAAVILILSAIIVILLKRKSENSQKETLCPQCGEPVKNGKNFCTSCGAKIE